LFVIAAIVEPHSNQFSIWVSPSVGSGSCAIVIGAFILPAVVSLDDFEICLALFITLSFVLHGCPLQL
jgi:hypothetical protein